MLPFTGWPVLGAEQVQPGLWLVAGLEGIAKRACDCGGRHCAETDQDPAREPRDAGPLASKPKIRLRDGRDVALMLVFAIYRNASGLVRTMRTRRSLPLSPRRNSAAANRRSTM